MKNIAVIGAGTMGNGIAHVFIQNGYNVNLIDISEDALKKAVATIGKNMDRMVAREKITKKDKTDSLSRLKTITDRQTGLAKVDLVVEAATENIDLKLKLFKQMDEFSPKDCILATNTSSISITRMAASTTRPDKVIGMHFMNPVPVMKLVEVIRGYATSDKVTEVIMDLSEKLGK